MRIRAALIGPSRAWEQLLLQEGFPYSVVDPRTQTLPDQYSVAIVHRDPDAAEREILGNYLRLGGALLGDVRHCAGIGGMGYREEYVQYILGEGKPPFRSLFLADLALSGAIPLEAADLRLSSNSYGVFAGPLSGGWAVLLPFDPGAALCDFRTGKKTFYSRYERLPAEQVSLVAKGEVRHIVREALEYLHLARGFPYVHLWYFPEDASNVFAFRVDSDAAPWNDVETLYRLAQERRLSLSWFLDVKSHESRLSHFAAMVGQEIGVHCYEHRVEHSTGANFSNFGKAKKILEAVGFKPEGFAAPFGIWTPDLAAVTQELGFRYSSEFSFAYDTLPLSPATSTEVFGVPQLPVHPICIGSLRQVGYTPRQMQEYFMMAVRWKMERREPLFFYHHPSHRGWETVSAILETSATKGVRSLTLGQFAHWWEQRLKVHPEIRTEGQWLHLDAASTIQSDESGVWMRVVRRGGQEAIIPLSGRVEFDHLTWSDPPAFTPPQDIHRIREFDPRRMLGDLYESMIRRIR